MNSNHVQFQKAEKSANNYRRKWKMVEKVTEMIKRCEV